MKTASTTRLSESHLGHLDALRGLAILGVVLLHTSVVIRAVGPTAVITWTGQRGVQLFYMISAFTLCLSLDGKRQEVHSLSNYFIRRFFRIAPLFYVLIVVNVLVKHIAPHYSSSRNLGHLDILMGFFFLNGVRPHAINTVVFGGWSIAVETTFYLLLPLLHRFFGTIRRSLLLFVMSAALLGSLSTYLASNSTDLDLITYFGFLWFPVEFPVFVLGILGYCIWEKYFINRIDKSADHKDVSSLLLLTSLVLYCGCLPFTDRQLYFSSFVFLPLILSLSIYPWRILVNKVTMFIGKISYSLYLLHFFVLLGMGTLLQKIDLRSSHPVSHYVFGQLAGCVLVYVVVLSISIPICMLSWKFIEQPGIRLGRRLIARREGRTIGSNEGSLIPSLHELEIEKSSRDAQF